MTHDFVYGTVYFNLNVRGYKSYDMTHTVQTKSFSRPVQG